MKQYIVDAFTDKLFAGNPAAVCVLDRWLSDELMQSIAIENNFSETAFTVREPDGAFEMDFPAYVLRPIAVTDAMEDALGVKEDPVTGSAHCVIAPYWARRLNKNTLTAYQASARTGILRIEVCGERVKIAGTAVLFAESELHI